MLSVINSTKYIRKYIKLINPVVEKRYQEYFTYSKRIKKLTVKTNARDALENSKFDVAVSSICAVYPDVDIPTAFEVMFSYLAIIRYLNTISIKASTSTEAFARVIYSSLKDALNLRNDSFEQYFTFFPSKDDNGYLSILVEKCRQKVRLLPSFDTVRDQLTAFVALFIDLQITKFSSNDNDKEVNLLKWSDAHGQKYSDLSNWEFCMAIDSPLSILTLLALATDPTLTEYKAESLLNGVFPGVCCIQKILEGYIYYNEDLSSGNINYDFYYENLKEYENRIIYFFKKSLKIKTHYSHDIRLSIRLLLAVYITHPKANEGMNKITNKALLKAGGFGMSVYTGAIKLLRVRKFF